MGIPGFFKWLTDKNHYPDIKRSCIEYEPSYDAHGAVQPLDATQPNPNGIEFDNLYLDMNNIIHLSTNSDNYSKPKTEDEVIKSIFDSIDRIFSIVRPRKLLYMSIDGVAPRAKLNDQRSRRFLESKDALDKAEQIARKKSEILANGGLLPKDQNQQEKIQRFDGNCITPGTPFMSRLANCLRYFIYNRMNKNVAWRSIKVILSDSNVPGEGEHKIINYIRRQRKHPNYDPETRHVLYGSDADLIILGLATHESHMTILRDEYDPNKPRVCDVCQQVGHDMKECTGIPKDKLGQNNELSSTNVKTKYIFVDLSLLRDKLHKILEEKADQSSFKWYHKRFLDDWVFLCLLVGNDFLPNLPSFEVYENVVDNLMNIYMKSVPKFNDYLTDNGTLKIKLLEIILIEFGKMEDEIFKNRHKVSEPEPNSCQTNVQAKTAFDVNKNKSLLVTTLPASFRPNFSFRRPDSSTNKSVEAKVQSDETQNVNSSTRMSSVSQKSDRDYDETKQETATSSIPNRQEEEQNDPNDTIRLWEGGWHERYYKSKFKEDQNNLDNIRMQVVQHYIQGLCWVLQYYYQGVPSWDWYYPYHYAPFASDFSNLNDVSINFNQNSEPFKPLEQLMSVFPPECAKYLPNQWQSLIQEKDSPIIDFYPLNFGVDSNGKRFRSQYVVLLPFIDEIRLHKTLQSYYSLLTSEEKQRNEHNNDLLFIHSENSYYSNLKEQLDGNKGKKITQENPIDIPTTVGIVGCIWRDGDDDKIASSGKTIKAPISNYINITNNQVMCIKYRSE